MSSQGQPPPQPPAQSQGSAQVTTAPTTFWGLIKAAFGWLFSNAFEAITATLIGAVFGFLVNFCMLAFYFDGHRKVGNGIVVGSVNVINGSLIWFVLSTVIFSLYGYYRAAGKERFWKEIGQLPTCLLQIVTVDGGAARSHLLWGAGISLLGTQFISPALSGAVGLALVTSVPTILGRIISNFLFRVWSFIVGLVKPGRDLAAIGPMTMLVGIIGSAGALAIGFLVPIELQS